MISVSYLAGNSLVTVEFDGAVRYLHESSAVVTEHPVEKGVNIADHVRPELDRLTVEAIVTNSPITVPRTNMSGVSGSTKSVEFKIPTSVSLPIDLPGVGAALKGAGLLNRTTTVSANVLQFDDEFDRVGSIYDEVRLLVSSGTLVGISTPLRQYENMLLKSLSSPKAKEDGDSIKFTFEAHEIRFSTTKEVPVPKRPTTTVAKKDLGQQPTTTDKPSDGVAWRVAHGVF